MDGRVGEKVLFIAAEQRAGVLDSLNICDEYLTVGCCVTEVSESLHSVLGDAAIEVAEIIEELQKFPLEMRLLFVSMKI